MKWLGKAWFWLNGWKAVGDSPSEPKYVLIAAPHTSNWDWAHMLAAAWVFDVKMHWLGKREIFDNPLGGMMRALGGVPVDRATSNSLVDQIIQRFGESETLTIVVPPSGTRRKRAPVSSSSSVGGSVSDACSRGHSRSFLSASTP